MRAVARVIVEGSADGAVRDEPPRLLADRAPPPHDHHHVDGAGRPPQPRPRPAKGPQLPGDRGGQVRAVDQMSGLLVEVLSYSSADSIETQVTLIKSYPILESVAKRLGRLPEMSAGGARATRRATGPPSTRSAASSRSPGCRTRASWRSRRPRRTRVRRATSPTPPRRRTASSTSRCGTRASPRRGGSSRTSSRTSKRAPGAPRRRSGRSGRPTGSSRPAPSPRCCSRSSPRCGGHREDAPAADRARGDPAAAEPGRARGRARPHLHRDHQPRRCRGCRRPTRSFSSSGTTSPSR